MSYTAMERALLDALVHKLDNDAQAEIILRLALPYFEREHERAVTIARGDASVPRQSGPEVLNIHTHGRPAGAVYIGRGSKWGNPFVIGRHGGRNQVIAQYRTMLSQTPELLAALPELRGKELLCYCAPLACHGHVLRDLANA